MNITNNYFNSVVESANTFIERFDDRKDCKIVLYGLGSYTAALVTMAQGFNIIGLMDSNPENIGKEFLGLPVISKEQAKSMADFIVINTSRFYWQAIYEQVRDIGVPLYYPNGEAAKENVAEHVVDMAEKMLTYDGIKKQIEEHDIVSFDLYDTLIMRKLCNNTDVFKIVEQRCKAAGGGLSYIEMRSHAVALQKKHNYTLDDIYDNMRLLYPEADTEVLKKTELEIEMAVTVPRVDIVKLYNYARSLGKEVVIISDMYLTKEHLRPILEKCGISVDDERLMISCERDADKNSGLMWEQFVRLKAHNGKKLLHIGDSLVGDSEQPKRYGVDTVKIASAQNLLEEITSTATRGGITTIYSSLSYGIIADELFNSPFAWKEDRGKYLLVGNHRFGKVVFSSLTLTYLLWIRRMCKKLGISRLFFMSRDGYFLMRDYLHLSNRIGKTDSVKAEYLYTSRKAVYTANCDKQEAIGVLKDLSFIGTFAEYMDTRWDVQIPESDENSQTQCIVPTDSEKIREWMKPYAKQIQDKQEIHRCAYLRYMEEKRFDKDCALVDLVYSGTIQHWLSVLSGVDIMGFYMAADISEDNVFYHGNMYPCFQEDSCAQQSKTWQYYKVIESFFTAPYGYVKYMDDDGEIYFAKSGKNQESFGKRELINSGIMSYIDEYLDMLHCTGLDVDDIDIDRMGTDRLFGAWMDGRAAFGQEVRDSFFFEDGLVNAGKDNKMM